MSSPPSLQATVEASCQRLEETALLMGVTLTREPESVTQLEEIIVALLGIGADEATLNGATFMVGTYLGEVLREKLGGNWINSHDNELVLSVKDTSYFPVAKARKFAVNPKGGDGLSFYVSAVLAAHA
jgi:hypothetical protein